MDYRAEDDSIIILNSLKWYLPWMARVEMRVSQWDRCRRAISWTSTVLGTSVKSAKSAKQRALHILQQLNDVNICYKRKAYQELP